MLQSLKIFLFLENIPFLPKRRSEPIPVCYYLAEFSKNLLALSICK